MAQHYIAWFYECKSCASVFDLKARKRCTCGAWAPKESFDERREVKVSDTVACEWRQQ